jgi:hypothetical protein
MKKPLIMENRDQYNDFMNFHNPDKYDHSYGEYAQVGEQNMAQINPVHPTGLEPPPKDW